MSKNVVIFDVDMPYKTLSKTKAKELKALTGKKERDRQGLFLAEGEKCVSDLLKAFHPEYLVCNSEWIGSHLELCKRYEEEILISDKRGLEIISSFSSLPDVIGVFRKPSEYSDALLLDKDKLYLLLDEIQDPGNLGTIIRTCDWFGVYDIYASENTVDAYGPKVVQSTMGSLARVRVHYTDLESLILSNRHIPVMGALLEGEPYKEFSSIAHGILLMGNEGRGISDKLKQLITLPLTIPPSNPLCHPDSLNVAIATSILLSHLTTKN